VYRLINYQEAYMNKNKRIFTGVLTGMLAVSLSAGTFAAVNNVSQIDTERSGTVKIHKIVENDGRYFSADGLASDGIQGAVEVDNIGFDAALIASIDNIEGIVISSGGTIELDADSGRVSLGTYYIPCEAADGSSVVGQLFDEAGIFPEATYILTASDVRDKTFSEIYEDLVSSHAAELENRQNAADTARETIDTDPQAYKDAVSELDRVAEGLGIRKVYTAKQLEDAVKQAAATIKEETVNSWVSSHSAQRQYTDSSGTATMSDLDLGLYLVAETDISSHDGFAGAWNDGMEYDPSSGTWSDSAAAQLPINNSPDHYYENGTVVRDPSTGAATDNSGLYHIQSIDAFGTETEHTYTFGEIYRESHNPEAPVIESKSAPFLVSVPSTNTADTEAEDVAEGDNYGKAGTVWQYTIDVFPKNQTTGIYKRIIDPDETDGAETLRTSEDFQIGDRISEVIWADAPVLQKAPDNRHRSFIIADTMSSGVELLSTAGPEDNSEDTGFRVCIIPKDQLTDAVGAAVPDNAGQLALMNNSEEYAGSELTFGEDYDVIITDDNDVNVIDELGETCKVVEKGTHGFAVRLLGNGLEKLNARTEDSVVAVWFDVMLGSSAMIGQVQENMNYPSLIYHNSNTSVRTVGGNYVYEYTYELAVQKRGVEDASNVRFIVSRKDTGDIAQSQDKDLTDSAGRTVYAGQHDSMRFVKETDGVYHVWTGTEDEVTEVSTVNGTDFNTLTPASDGRLFIKGLDSDTYVFREIATEQGKNLLKSSFEVVFTARDDEQESIRSGILESASVRSENAQTPSDISIGVAGSGTNDALESGAANMGIAGLSVDNFDAVDLRTGGNGRTAYYIAGGALAVLVTAGCAAGSRRSKRKAAKNR